MLLLTDLQWQVRLLEEDLRERSEDFRADDTGELKSRLEREHRRAVQEGRIAASYESWRDEQVTQAAVAWVLATVLLRFCEDNELTGESILSEPWIGLHSYALKAVAHLAASSGTDLLLSAMAEVESGLETEGFFDPNHDLLWNFKPSDRAVEQLIAFWHQAKDDGRPVHNLTDSRLDTRFLAVLYESLSESTRKRYALLETPSFTADFLLDHTLDHAVEEFGLDGMGGSQADHPGFRLIDPVCGSGTFLLGAFHRLLARWRSTDPDISDTKLIYRTLRSLHGADRNPIAVAITRFRLLMAAIRESDWELHDHFPGNPTWPIIVAVGDSLTEGQGARAAAFADRGRSTELVPSKDGRAHYVDTHGLLMAGSYHVVVGNPPYITVKDRAEHEFYRNHYSDVASGSFALTVPFTARFFELALRADAHGEAAGYVGQLTANSFMKREFGKKLVEGFLRERVRLTHVIDTSGAYIPGHGAPTAILIGRNAPPGSRGTVRTVIGLRGEPKLPADPAEGDVWRAIVEQVERPGSSSEWVTCGNRPAQDFATHPWNLAAPGATTLMQRMDRPHRLRHETARIGYRGITGSDEIFTAPAVSFRRGRAEPQAETTVITGSEIRDWAVHSDRSAFFPRPGNRTTPLDLAALPGHARRLWPFRTLLANRRGLGKERWWYDWHHVTTDFNAAPWSIAFPWVATHTHFALVDDTVTPLQSAPVIKLGPGATHDDHFGLLGVLNSSTICFWCKQVSTHKGSQVHDGALRSSEAWELIYEYTSTKLGELPLPQSRPLETARELHDLGRRLIECVTGIATPECPPTQARVKQGRGEWSRIRSRMVALQEELDWQTYRLYEIAPEADLPVAETNRLPQLAMGERAFEIVLARRLAAGQVQTHWFDRHGSTPITEIPNHWPKGYREVVQRRIDAIERDPSLAELERPEYKRRWALVDWDDAVRDTVRTWLLDRCERPKLWYETTSDGRQHPTARTVGQIAELLRPDPEVLAAVEVYHPEAALEDALLEILQPEHVPFLAALRYRASALGKRAAWEREWQLQEEEDSSDIQQAGMDSSAELPKYTSADFLKSAYWRLRGKLDVPNERFTSYDAPVTSLSFTSVLGWAGWDAKERAEVLIGLIDHRLEYPDGAQRVVPLVAGLLEVLPWIGRTGRGLGPLETVDDTEIKAKADEYLATLGMSEEEVAAWRPPAPRRGRPRKDS